VDIFTFQLELWGNVLAILVLIMFAGCIIMMFTQRTSPAATTATPTSTAASKKGGLFHRLGVLCSLAATLLGADMVFQLNIATTAKTYVVMVSEVASEVAARHSDDEASAHSALAQCEGDEDEVDVDGGFELKLKPGFTLFTLTQKPFFSTAFSFEYKDGYPVLYTHFPHYTRAFDYARRKIQVENFWWKDKETGKVFLSGTKKSVKAQPSSQPQSFDGIDCTIFPKIVQKVTSTNLTKKLDEAMPEKKGIQPKKYKKMAAPKSFDQYIETERMLGRPAILCRN
jgi:hypothetical protein